MCSTVFPVKDTSPPPPLLDAVHVIFYIVPTKHAVQYSVRRYPRPLGRTFGRSGGVDGGAAGWSCYFSKYMYTTARTTNQRGVGGGGRYDFISK